MKTHKQDQTLSTHMFPESDVLKPIPIYESFVKGRLVLPRVEIKVGGRKPQERTGECSNTAGSIGHPCNRYRDGC